MKKRILSIILIFSIVFTGIFVDNKTYAKDEDVLVENFDEKFDGIDEIVNERLELGSIPGAVVLVSQKGKIVYEKAFGYGFLNDMGERLENPRPMTVDTLFDLASVTKVMATTQSIMKLVDQGKIDLDEKVIKYIPEFGQNGKENVTIRQLLTHTSGLPQWEAIFLYVNKDRDEVLKYINSLPLMFEPGEEKYSDIGFQTLGFVIEAVSGMPMEEYAKENIYKPLGLENTTYLPLENGFTKDRIAATSFGNPYENAMVDEINHPGIGYDMTKDLEAFKNFDNSRWRDYTLIGEVNDGNTWMANGGVAGHAGLYSTARDLAVISQMMLNGGEYNGVRIYSKEVIDEFTSMQNNSKERGLGFELAKTWYMGDSVSDVTFGHTGFTGTQIIIDKGNETAVIILTNKQNVGFRDEDSFSYWSTGGLSADISEFVRKLVESPLDLSKLKDIIALGEEKIDNIDYSKESREELKEAINNAKKWLEENENITYSLDNENLLKEEINKVNEKIDGLKIEDKKDLLDTSSLKELISLANKELEKKDKYTSESINNLKEVVDNANKWLEDNKEIEKNEENQKVLDEFIASIKDNMDKLVKITDNKKDNKDKNDKEKGNNKVNSKKDKGRSPKTGDKDMVPFIIIIVIAIVILLIIRKNKKNIK